MAQQLKTQSSAPTAVAISAGVMVEVRNLVKSYHHKTVVNNVSFAIGQGEIFGVLGPNGAGKTTTLEMIEGIRTPDSGTAILAGLGEVDSVVNVGAGAGSYEPVQTIAAVEKFLS